MKWTALIAALLFSCVTLSIFAKPMTKAIAINHHGIYLDVGFGVGTISCINCSSANRTVTHTNAAHLIDVGYQFNSYLALELDLSMLQPFSYDSILTPSLITTPTSQAANMAIKGMLPINKQFRLFGKVGNGIIWLPNREGEKTEFSHKSIYLATGFAMQITPHASAALSYHRSTADHLTIDSGIVSATILF